MSAAVSFCSGVLRSSSGIGCRLRAMEARDSNTSRLGIPMIAAAMGRFRA